MFVRSRGGSTERVGFSSQCHSKSLLFNHTVNIILQLIDRLILASPHSRPSLYDRVSYAAYSLYPAI